MYLASVQCLRTACTSLPVLVAHGEDLLYPVIHRFGEPAELLTFLLPVDVGGAHLMSVLIQCVYLTIYSGFKV